MLALSLHSSHRPAQPFSLLISLWAGANARFSIARAVLTWNIPTAAAAVRTEQAGDQMTVYLTSSSAPGFHAMSKSIW